MPLRIRCPECKHVMVVGDQLAGRVTACEACHVRFNVPMPVSVPYDPDALPTALACPRCQYENAFGTTACRRCGTDLSTGRRPPWLQRWRYWSPRRWFDMVGLAALLAVLAIIGPQQWRAFERGRRAPPPSIERPVDWPPPFGVEAAALLSAGDVESHRAALRALQAQGAVAAPAIALALTDSLADPADSPVLTLNRVSAVEFLAEHAHEHRGQTTRWRGLLIRCQRTAGLRSAAVYGRAMLGDGLVRDALADLWRDAVRSDMFLRHLVQISERPDPQGLQAQAAAAAKRLARRTQALQRLAVDDPNEVLAPLAAGYWSTWGWLGQRRGEAYLAALFEATKPFRPGPPGPAQTEIEVRDSIRGAREVCERIGESDDPLAAAATAAMMVQHMPQYRSARDRIAERLVDMLPTCTPAEQQCIVWALAHGTQRLFGAYSDKQAPSDVGLQEVLAVLEAYGRLDAVTRSQLRRLEYPQPARLTYRVVRADWQTAGELLTQMRAWPTATTAMLRWRAQGLGWNDALQRALDPTQAPQYSALAASLALSPLSAGDEQVRRTLELWSQAFEQPAWVRGLALTALGALDARAERASSPWPAELSPAALALDGAEAPTFDHYGLLLTFGGEPMQQRLRAATDLQISPAQQRALLEAAQRVAAAEETRR